MRCNVYNPLAGGFLSGKYTVEHLSCEDKTPKGRFTKEFDFVPRNLASDFKGKGHIFYRKRYFNETMFKALAYVAEDCQKEDIPIAESALRWLRYHSFLTDKDGIIIGASKLDHCKQNVQCLEKGKLPESVVDAAENAWNTAKSVAESYFRGYGTVPGDSTGLYNQIRELASNDQSSHY
mmetsp:Transcript_12382/g.15033  ORF Transcript_12382/g.15033 Transcript_12382/m.15033 type:complete len:179 (-) Transcript_12382:487-1023(-)